MTRNHQDRSILQRTAGKLFSAVRHIECIVDWMAGDGALSYGGATVAGFVDELRRCKPELSDALQCSAFFLADEWTYIENNKARLAEMNRFLDAYACFHDRVMEYDDARIDNQQKAWALLDDYMQPQEYVVMIDRFDREFEFQKGHLREITETAAAKKPLEGLALKLSHNFCTGLSDEDYYNLIAHHQLPMLRGNWFGEKNYATFFGKRCGLSCAEMNACFDFSREDDRSRNIKLSYSKNDDDKVGPSSTIFRILNLYPIDSIRTENA